MSRIYFHSESDTHEIYGSERAFMGEMINSMALAILEPTLDKRNKDSEPIRAIMPADSYVLSAPDFRRAFDTWFRVSNQYFWGWADDDDPERFKKYPLFDIQLNTALRTGGDVWKLFARVHGQCELHAYIEGENRSWFADIIEQGCQLKMLRNRDSKWAAIASFLRSRVDEPIVMSYSVCDRFPNFRFSDGWLPYDDENEDEHVAASEAYYGLPHAEAWAQGMKHLRKKQWLEIKPDNWHEYYFTNGVTCFDICDWALHNEHAIYPIVPLPVTSPDPLDQDAGPR